MGTDVVTATAVAVDASGNVIVAGAFAGTVDFGGGPLTAAGSASSIFVASFDCSGALRWSKGFGVPTQANDAVAAVAVDAGGNIVVAGQFEGTIDFGAGALTSQKTDAFVAKLGPAGDGLWSKRYGDVKSQDLASGVAVDAAGNVFVAGLFEGAVDFGGGVIHSGGNGHELFLLALGPAGNHRWSKGIGQPAGTPSVAVDPLGRVLMCGVAGGDLDFGDGQVLSGAALFLAQLDGAGTRVWSQGYGGAGTSVTCSRVAADAAGNAVITGAYSGVLDLGAGPLPNPDGSSALMGYVARVSSAGAPIFSLAAGPGGNSAGNGVAADGGGSVFAVGTFDTSLSFGGAALMSSGDDDVFAARLSPGGALAWQSRFGDSAAQEGLAVAVGGDGVPVVVGNYLGHTTFGSVALPVVAANGGAFVARLAP